MIYIKDITPEQLSSYVGILTISQKDSLIGQTYDPDSYFNPIQDINDYWVISTEEMIYCENPNFLWVKELPLIIYEPKPLPFPFPPA